MSIKFFAGDHFVIASDKAVSRAGEFALAYGQNFAVTFRVFPGLLRLSLRTGQDAYDVGEVNVREHEDPVLALYDQAIEYLQTNPKLLLAGS